jgi:hypothetical protein
MCGTTAKRSMGSPTHLEDRMNPQLSYLIAKERQIEMTARAARPRALHAAPVLRRESRCRRFKARVGTAPARAKGAARECST